MEQEPVEKGVSKLREQSVIAQLIGAMVRAIIVIIVISTPTLLLPVLTPEGPQVMILITIFAALFIFSEYSSTYPGLIEFRDAAPFNRVRIIGLFFTLFLLSLVAITPHGNATLVLIVNATGLVLAHSLDFAYSPLWLLEHFLPENATQSDLTMLRTMGGLSFLIGILTLSIFAILMRLGNWPSRDHSFNVWINLPTFDPTTGGDVVRRLVRVSRLNYITGLVLPFIMPIVASLGFTYLEFPLGTSMHLQIWMVSLWSFLPASLLMRGMAMARIASMVDERRRQHGRTPANA